MTDRRAEVAPPSIYQKDYRHVSLDVFDPGHGKDCACLPCLKTWMHWLNDHYKGNWTVADIPGTSFVLARSEPYRYQHNSRAVYDRVGFLTMVKAWAAHTDYSTPYEDPTGVSPLVAL